MSTQEALASSGKPVLVSLAMMEQALREAIEKAGGPSALARKLGIAHQAVSQWVRAPATRVLQIERLTGVRRSRLRPDVYPPDDHGPTPSPAPSSERMPA